MQLVRTVVGPLIGPLATAGIVIVFVIFMLLKREDLRDRLIRLAGARDLPRTTEALDDAAQRVGRYLLMQLVVNVTYGIPIGIGLWLIGVPNPVLWGMLATVVLRFVPYIGPVIAAFFPLALAIAVDPELDDAAVDRRAVHRHRADQQQRRRAVALRHQHRTVTGRRSSRRRSSGPGCGVRSAFCFPRRSPSAWSCSGGTFRSSRSSTSCSATSRCSSPDETLYQRLLVGDPDEATERAEEYLQASIRSSNITMRSASRRWRWRRRTGCVAHSTKSGSLRVVESAMLLIDNLVGVRGKHFEVGGSEGGFGLRGS